MGNYDIIWIEIAIFLIVSLCLICAAKKREAKYNIVESEIYSSLIIILMLIISVIGYTVNNFKRSMQAEFGLVILWAFFNYIRIHYKLDINKVIKKVSLSAISEFVGSILFILLVLTYIFVSIQYFMVSEFVLIICLIWMIYYRNG